MIRFCDKEVKEIYYKDMTRSQMLLYFLQSEKQRRSVIFIYDDEKYCGMVTYQDILAHTELNDCINEKVFIADDNLWNEAKQEFDKAKHPLYPIVSDEGELLSFIYNDELKNYEYYIGFVQFEKAKELPISFEEWQPDCKIICIVDFNEWAFRLYNALRRLGVNVCVIGEKWEWFGISQKENLNNYMEWEVFYFYAEGKVNNKKQLMSGIGYESIWNEYSVLWEWERRCFYHYYKVFAEFLLQNDVAVVSVSLPDSNDKSFYLTKDELENIYYGIEAVYQTKFATQQQLENMKKICGTKEVERIMDKNYVETYEIDFNVSDWNYITFNEISAMTMGDTDAKRIWLIGPCIAFGFRNFQENSLVTLLNNLVKDNGYSVVRVAVSCGNFTVFKEEYEKLPIREQDIVVLLGHKSDMELMPGTHIDLKDLYDDTTRENWITNGESFHTNKYGNKAIADAIYERYLKSKIHEKTSKKTNKYVQKGEILSDDLQDKVKEYVEEIIINNNNNITIDDNNVGAIVMNCNPFTLGHQYLIEYAASKVDYLYVFVVEEDKSDFAFADRFNMVKLGTAHLKNVYVVPSGEWVLSYKTLPVYFGKSENRSAKVNAVQDLMIFGKHIANALNIKYRFVGEEPTDMVTKQYNEQMRTILGMFAIQVEEIPRKMIANEVISASRVRKYMKEDKWDEVSKLVPKTTYEYLLNIRNS